MSWKASILLSILIPISLLTTFRLTGILPEPPTPETTTIDTVSWNMSRPTQTVVIDMFVNNSYAREAVLVDFCLRIAGYLEDFPTPYGDLDDLRLYIAANANTRMIVGYRWFDHTNHYSWVEDSQLPLYCEICGDDVVRILMNETGAEFRAVRF